MSDEYTPTTADVRGRYSSRTSTARPPAVAAAEFDRWLTAHGAEVARQQAERDAQIAERFDYGSKVQPEKPRADARARAIAGTIRAQFANPSTTPKETR